MFGKQDFWYYNSKLYPFQNQDTPTYADKSDLREKLKKYNVVMLMSSEINLHCGFWNFAEEAFYAFHPELNNPHLERIENSIRNDRDWFRSMVEKSKSQSSPLSQMVRADAEFVFFKAYDNLDGKSAEDSIQYIRLTIRNSPEWLAIIAKKAVERNIPIDSMMMLDAIYTYNQLKKKE
jgi:hypothetical protein